MAEQDVEYGMALGYDIFERLSVTLNVFQRDLFWSVFFVLRFVDQLYLEMLRHRRFLSSLSIRGENHRFSQRHSAGHPTGWT